MLRIALVGYGRMGKAIEEIILEENNKLPAHEQIVISHKIDESNLDLMEKTSLQTADVAIEFTHPETAVENILKCFDAGVPVVCGTTGWLHDWDTITKKCLEGGHAFFYAPNFSIGVNLFFRLNQILAEMMESQPEYRAEMEEIHHTGKKDAPSGTAIRLAEDLLKRNSKLNKWENTETNDTSALPIISKRIEGVPGTHTVTYKSEIDDIEIKHTAHSRKGFASGAFKAAQWLHDKKGVFGMEDMLNHIFKQSR